MATHNTNSSTYRADQGDAWVEGRTTVVLDGWNFSTQTSSADTLMKVSCFRVLDRDVPGWHTERHPTLDGRVIDLGDSDWDTKERVRAEIAREAYNLGVLGQFVHYSSYVDNQYVPGPSNPHYVG